MYAFAPEKTRYLVYDDFCIAIRLSFCEFIIRLIGFDFVTRDGFVKTRNPLFRHADTRDGYHNYIPATQASIPTGLLRIARNDE
jgi:hypothetical protein